MAAEIQGDASASQKWFKVACQRHVGREGGKDRTKSGSQKDICCLILVIMTHDFEVRAFREKTCRKASWTWGFKLEDQQHQRFAEIQSFEVLNSSSFGTKEAVNIVTQSLTSCNFIQCIVNTSQWMLVPILNLTAFRPWQNTFYRPCQCGSCTLHYVRQATIKASFIEKLLWGAQWSWVDLVIFKALKECMASTTWNSKAFFHEH